MFHKVTEGSRDFPVGVREKSPTPRQGTCGWEAPPGGPREGQGLLGQRAELRDGRDLSPSPHWPPTAEPSGLWVQGKPSPQTAQAQDLPPQTAPDALEAHGHPSRPRGQAGACGSSLHPPPPAGSVPGLSPPPPPPPAVALAPPRLAGTTGWPADPCPFPGHALCPQAIGLRPSTRGTMCHRAARPTPRGGHCCPSHTALTAPQSGLPSPSPFWKVPESSRTLDRTLLSLPGHPTPSPSF